LKDLSKYLELSRLPPALPLYNNDPWGRGFHMSYLQNLTDYWKNTYNWRQQEKILNEKLPQFRTVIDDIDFHFVHIVSKHPNAEPLIFIHGWPGSFYECIKIAELLVNPPDGEPAFHLVCPSVPGFGYTKLSPNKEMPDQIITARYLHKLMLKLGYNKYWIQGGDWGSAIGKLLASENPDHIYGFHTNMPIGFFPFQKGIFPALWSICVYLFPSYMLSAEDYSVYQTIPRALKLAEEMGYFALQSTKPQTIGNALHDSPVGLAAWIIEKFQTFSDCKNGNLENCFTKDVLLTNVMIYWTSGSITSSVNYYFEHLNSPNNVYDVITQSYVSVPTAGLVFPKELIPGVQAFAQYHYNIQRWTVEPVGGHFAALEQPEVLVKDVRKFRQQLSQKNTKTDL